MAVTLSLFAGAGAQFFDNNGNVLSGGKIQTFQAGTTTPLAAYTTNSESAFHTNPIILDAAGRVPSGGEIWLQLGIGYKFVLRTSADVLIATYDNIPSSAQPPAANDADSIMYEQGYTVTAGSFIAGKIYRIASVGTTDFTLIGAVSNTVGTHFIATGVGTGTGTAELSQTVETKLRDTVSFKDFGAVGDGVTDDTTAVRSAITYACANNVNIDGGNFVYAVSGAFSLTNATCKFFGISNATIKSTGENTNEALLTITVLNADINLDNFRYDGDIENKYTINNMEWYGLNPASTGASFGVSVWPIASTNDFALEIRGTNINCDNISLVNSHSCGFSFVATSALKIDGFIALNTTFTSLYSLSGVTQITNYYAVDCGRPLPAAFDVYNNSTATWSYGVGQSDGFYAQGSFGLRLGGNGSISLTNAYVKNYYTTAIVLDTRSTSNISNIYIENDQDVTITNQVSGAIFYELSKGSSASNIHINMKKRNETVGTNLFSIYLYTEFGSCNFDNVILQDSLSASLVNYTFFVVDNEGSQINLSNFAIQNTRTTGHVSLHGRLNFPSRQPGKANVNGVSVIGNAQIDFRDFRHVAVSSVIKNTSSVVGVFVGQFQAPFPNTAYISDSDLSEINGISAGSGVNIDNCTIVGRINVTGETGTDCQSSITNCNITLNQSGQFSASGSQSSIRIADNIFTTDVYNLTFRDTGILEFTNNIIRYNGTGNGITTSGGNVSIVKNIGTTALRGPAATVPVGYSLAGTVATFNANNDTVTFDFT